LREAVEQLQALDTPAGPEPGTYVGRITTSGPTAMVIGNGNEQNNTFK
jgi:hypothetical protein